LSSVLSGVKGTTELRWASPLEVKDAVENAFTEKYGVKEAAKPKGKVSQFDVRIILQTTQLEAGTEERGRKDCGTQTNGIRIYTDCS